MHYTDVSVCVSVLVLWALTFLSSGCSTCDDAAYPTVAGEQSAQSELVGASSGEDARDSSAGYGRMVDPDELEQLRGLSNEDPTEALWVGEPTEVANAEWGELRRFPWRVGPEFGLGWHIRITRDEDLAVVGVTGTRAFDAILEESERPVRAAINGGFFDGEGQPLDMILAGGREIVPLRESGGSGVFIVRDGQADILHRSADLRGASEALQSIDRIVDGGASLVRRQSSRRAARAAVVLTSKGVELVVIAHGESIEVDGTRVNARFTSGFGLTLAEFADYLTQSVDADKALNLDGGPSVQLRYHADDGSTLSVAGSGPTASGIVVVDHAEQ